MSDKKMSDEEAKELLAQLSEHFGEPIRPISQYCEAFHSYAHVIREKYKHDAGHPYAKYLGAIVRDISKSSLLARLIYGGERLRTRRCPIHEGRWSGCVLSPEQDCSKGCGLTGWILEPEDGGPAHGTPEEEWRSTTRWEVYEDGKKMILTNEEMIERERVRKERKGQGSGTNR